MTGESGAAPLPLPFDGEEIRARWPGLCIACSPDHPHGLRLRFRHTEEGVVSRCSVPSSFCGFAGIVHGGIVTTLMDEAAAWALFSRQGRFAVTQGLSVRFHRPVPSDTEITVEARIAESDDRHAQIQTFVWNNAGVLLAEGESRWVYTRIARIAAQAGVSVEAMQAFLDDCRRSPDTGDGG